MRKNIFFLRLDWSTLLPIALFRISGYRIWFFDASKYFKDVSRIERYAKWDVQWLNHHDHGHSFSAGEFERNLQIQSERIVLHLRSLESFQHLSKAMQSQDLEAAISQKVLTKIFQSLELIYLSRAVLPGRGFLYFWLPNTLIMRRLLTCYADVENKCPQFLGCIDSTIIFLERMINVISSKLCKFTSDIIFRSTHVFNKVSSIESLDSYLAVEDAPVIYFPHQGIFYGNFFAKDHFYSELEGSPFLPKKILHIEFDDSKDLGERTRRYYLDRHITNIKWSSLPFSNVSLLWAVLKYGFDCARRLFVGLDFDLLIMYMSLVWSTQKSLQRIKKFKALKIVLVGYDILFPQTIALACRLAKVKTIAVQERMLASWIMGPLLLDYYFVLGTSAGNHHRRCAPPQCRVIELGPIRLKNHRVAQVPKLINEVRKKYDFVVLALDYHSETNWFGGKSAIANNWRNNMLFYEHLMVLCKAFPNAYFLLKGKNFNFLEIDFFQDMVAVMRLQHNLMLLQDQDIWTPFTSVAAADIAVARHTSLADEMLALGKPVIFDDYDGFPSKIYDYGNQLTAYSLEDIQNKLDQFFRDPTAYKAMIKKVCKNFYCPSDYPVQEVLQNHLHEIYDCD